MKTIRPDELSERIAAGEISKSQILDVRTPLERREIHIEGSSFLPLDSMNVSDVGNITADGPTYLLCRSGARAAKACEILCMEGANEPTVIDGGILAWRKAGLPVVVGSAVMSLERQVRVAAGLLVFLGAVLGFLVHPYWHFLSAFVGAGLVFAGVTDSCAMGMALARMPWNRRHHMLIGA